MILVTGGTGFVGSHLLYHLVVAGENVRAIKRPTSSMESCKIIFGYYTKDISELFSKIEWVDADLLDVDELYNAMHGVNRVFHAGALVSFDSRRKNEVVEVNQKGTANLVNISLELGIDKFCFVSSIAALGNDAQNITVSGMATGINVGTYASNLAAGGAVLSNYNPPVFTKASAMVI